MNQDEAWEMQAKVLHGNGALRRDCFEAGWDAALADTLGLLERLAKNFSQPVYIGPKLMILTIEDDGTPCEPRYYTHGREITRDEALALLAGEEKKE